MRSLFLPAAALAALTAAAAAQSLEEKLEAKLAKPFVKAAPWILDYEAALARAKESKKVVFAYFTRSFAP